MNPNGHTKSVRERLVSTLELNGGQMPLRSLVYDYSFKRREIDDELEKAACPFGIQIHHNGRPKPIRIVVLKNYTPPPPAKPVSQEQLKARLNSMSTQEYYAMIDPTYAIRRSSHGRHRRTSTGADEYLRQTES